jgi:hypothetical protein
MLSKSPPERQGDPADGFHIPDFLDRRTTAWLDEAERRQEAQRRLVSAIKAHIEKGDRCREKADQHYVSAGQHLKTLKADHAATWAEWEAVLRDRVKISTGRASELMQIADGRKTVAGLRAADAEKHKRLRAESSSGRPEEVDAEAVDEPDVETTAASAANGVSAEIVTRRRRTKEQIAKDWADDIMFRTEAMLGAALDVLAAGKLGDVGKVARNCVSCFLHSSSRSRGSRASSERRR